MWYRIENEMEIATPALAVFPQRVRENIRAMQAMVDVPDRLCPHVKTHKLAEVTRMYLEEGITGFKCATLSELEMVTSAGASFALLAFQPVGPHGNRLIACAERYPQLEVATVVDNLQTATQLSSLAQSAQTSLTVLLDLDVGMHRTGIACGPEAETLYARIAKMPGLVAGGLHAYDGHHHQADRSERSAAVEAGIQDALSLRAALLRAGLPVPRFICGGTPSFPCHAPHPERICSPGTPILWDTGYAESFPDLVFQPAAVLLTRVVSKLDERTVCLDLGHKAVASEMRPPRVRFLDLEQAQEGTHSEEHLVVQTPTELSVGEMVYALPRHICPTMALHEHVVVIEAGRAVGTWHTVARQRHRPWPLEVELTR